MYQVFMFGLVFGIWASFYYPVLFVYQANNKHRTYDAAIAKEKAYKKLQREKEAAAEAASETEWFYSNHSYHANTYH